MKTKTKAKIGRQRPKKNEHENGKRPKLDWST